MKTWARALGVLETKADATATTVERPPAPVRRPAASRAMGTRASRPHAAIPLRCGRVRRRGARAAGYVAARGAQRQGFRDTLLPALAAALPGWKGWAAAALLLVLGYFSLAFLLVLLVACATAYRVGVARATALRAATVPDEDADAGRPVSREPAGG